MRKDEITPDEIVEASKAAKVVKDFCKKHCGFEIKDCDCPFHRVSQGGDYCELGNRQRPSSWYFSNLYYKGYVTTVRYDVFNKTYHGVIENVRDFVNWESDTKYNCYNEFKSACDDYENFKKELELNGN